MSYNRTPSPGTAEDLDRFIMDPKASNPFEPKQPAGKGPAAQPGTSTVPTFFHSLITSISSKETHRNQQDNQCQAAQRPLTPPVTGGSEQPVTPYAKPPGWGIWPSPEDEDKTTKANEKFGEPVTAFKDKDNTTKMKQKVSEQIAAFKADHPMPSVEVPPPPKPNWMDNPFHDPTNPFPSLTEAFYGPWTPRPKNPNPVSRGKTLEDLIKFEEQTRDIYSIRGRGPWNNRNRETQADRKKKVERAQRREERKQKWAEKHKLPGLRKGLDASMEDGVEGVEMPVEQQVEVPVKAVTDWEERAKLMESIAMVEEEEEM